MILKKIEKLSLCALVSMGMCIPQFGICDDQPEKKTPSKEELFAPDYINRLSQAYGHFIQKSLDNPILKLDFNSVVQGMQDGKNGKPSPMTEQEYEEAINLIQEYAYQDMSARNLEEAETFLKKNAKESGVIELEPGKLQYKVVQSGTGQQVTDETMPMINYTGKYLNGQVFGSSQENGGPISISLNQTIPGFRKAVLGMRQGEKRLIYIHPELGYGTSGQLLPNAMLIFEVEVTDVKPKPPETKAPAKDGDDSNDDDTIAALTYGPDEPPSDEAEDDDAYDDSDDSDEDDSIEMPVDS